MNKKKMGLTVASLGLVGVVGLSATLAFLSDQTQTVTNTFTMGANVKIALDEKNVTNPDGARVMQNTYEDVVANKVLVKDPQVTVVKDNDKVTEQYVFMAVKNGTDGKINIVDIDAQNWTKVEDNDLPAGITVYRYNTTVTEKTTDQYTENDEATIYTEEGIQLPKLFNKVKVAESVENTADTKEMGTIEVRAAAIQAEGYNENSAYTEIKAGLIAFDEVTK